jgi:hypothetical protein
MDSPETYNRVSNIEKNILRSLLSVFSTLLLSASIGSLIYTYLTTGIPPINDLAIYAGGAFIAIVTWYYAKTLTSYCHFCGGDLAHINRDMILSSEYLAMQGTKKGDYYYAPCQWGQKHAATGWAKISHRAAACHHCRISQEGYQPHYEAASQEELTEIQNGN